MLIKIDKGIEIPEKIQGLAKNCYSDLTKTMLKMEIGDSFFLAEKSYSYLHSYRKRIKFKVGYDYTIKRMTEGGITGVRVWRIE